MGISRMIRAAAESDIPALIEMGRRFFQASGYGDLAAFDRESFTATVQHLMAGGGVCLVAETDGQVVGMAGALAYPFYFNADHKTGQELFWWLNPEHRGGLLGARLFAGLESWAQDQGCASFTMVALDAVRPEQVGGMYKRRGYRASEHTYIKEL